MDGRMGGIVYPGTRATGSHGERRWAKAFLAGALSGLFAGAVLVFPPGNNADRRPATRVRAPFPPRTPRSPGTSPHGSVWVCAPHRDPARNHPALAGDFLFARAEAEARLSSLRRAVDPRLTLQLCNGDHGRRGGRAGRGGERENDGRP